MRRLAAEHGGLHRAFEAGIAAKALMGLAELLAGGVLLGVGPARLQEAVETAARWELLEDPGDPIARRVLAAAERLSPGTEHFYALYLLAHGVLKLVMVTLLWRRLAIAYPAAIAIQAAFITIELHRFATAHNPLLLGLAGLDAVILGLIWHEWRHGGAIPRG